MKLVNCTIGLHKLVARELTAHQVHDVYERIEKGYTVTDLDLLFADEVMPEFVVNMSLDTDLGRIFANEDLAPSVIHEAYVRVKEANPFLARSLTVLNIAGQAKNIQMLTGITTPAANDTTAGSGDQSSS